MLVIYSEQMLISYIWSVLSFNSEPSLKKLLFVLVGQRFSLLKDFDFFLELFVASALICDIFFDTLHTAQY